MHVIHNITARPTCPHIIDAILLCGPRVCNLWYYRWAHPPWYDICNIAGWAIAGTTAGRHSSSLSNIISAPSRLLQCTTQSLKSLTLSLCCTSQGKTTSLQTSHQFYSPMNATKNYTSSSEHMTCEGEESSGPSSLTQIWSSFQTVWLDLCCKYPWASLTSSHVLTLPFRCFLLPLGCRSLSFGPRAPSLSSLVVIQRVFEVCCDGLASPKQHICMFPFQMRFLEVCYGMLHW